MKTLQTSAAIACGILIAIGFAGLPERDPWTMNQIIPGVIIGTGTAASMIRHPEHVTRQMLLFVILLLITLVAYNGFTGTTRDLLTAAVWSLLYFGALVTFVLTKPNHDSLLDRESP